MESVMSEDHATMEPVLTLTKDWDFNHGKKVQAEVLSRFNSAVHHPSSSTHGCFFLLAYFRRFTFRLSEETVSWALHLVLGGSPAGFHVRFESDRHFRFSVASKDVGFYVYALKRITTKQFDVYFHLWRDGAANWQHEYSAWNIEEEKQWTTVSYKKVAKQNRSSKRVSFAHKLVQDSPIKKSSPVLAPPAIKVGQLFCPINSEKQKVKFGGKFSNSNSSIQSKKIFSRLKQDLAIDIAADYSTSCVQPEATHSESQPQVKKVLPPQLFLSKQCFKCLAWGHIAKVCTSPLRCKSCFGYYHLARNCFKRKNKHGKIWVKRSYNNKLSPSCTDNGTTLPPQAEVQVSVFGDITVQKGDQNQGGPGTKLQSPLSAPPVQPALELNKTKSSSQRSQMKTQILYLQAPHPLELS